MSKRLVFQPVEFRVHGDNCTSASLTMCLTMMCSCFSPRRGSTRFKVSSASQCCLPYSPGDSADRQPWDYLCGKTNVFPSGRPVSWPGEETWPRPEEKPTAPSTSTIIAGHPWAHGRGGAGRPPELRLHPGETTYGTPLQFPHPFMVIQMI